MIRREENNGIESPYQRVQRELSDLIGKSKAGDRLPTEPELAVQLGVSRSTLREAMRSFETQGLLLRRQGAGTFVADHANILEAGLEVLESLETIAERLDLDLSMGGLKIQTISVKEDFSKALNLSTQEEALSVSRIILIKDHPAAFLEDILPLDILTPSELEGFSGSVLDLLIKKEGLRLEQSKADIKVIPAPYHVARELDIQRGEGLLMFEADLLTDTGRVIDHSYSYFLPGYFHFYVNRRIGII